MNHVEKEKEEEKLIINFLMLKQEKIQRKIKIYLKKVQVNFFIVI